MLYYTESNGKLPHLFILNKTAILVPEFAVKNLPFLQPFLYFTYVTTHSPTLPSLYLRHSSFSNPSVASPTSQFILKPFFLLLLRHKLFI